MPQTQINGGTQIRAGSITSDRLAAGTLDKTAVGLGNVDNTSDANKPVSTATQTALNLKQDTSAKGVANGYASLDGGGKVPVSQLPNSIMEYQGTWNASTNTPTLANGTGSPGDVYRVSVAGTALTLTFGIGDYAIYNGSTWEKSDSTDAVTTVNSLSGDVVLTQDNIASGTTNKAFTATEQTKLAGIATGATANSTDAILFARANHTGTQLAATISDFNSAADSRVTAGITGKENTIAAGTTAQYYRGDKTFQTLNADVVPDGTTNKAFTATEKTKLAGVATGATANSTDAVLLARANHTGTQLASTISDFGTAVSGKFVTRETPTGTVNGTNTTFTLANTPVAGSESVFLNGILQEPGAGNDYTISAAVITYLTAPVTNDKIRVSYVK